MITSSLCAQMFGVENLEKLAVIITKKSAFQAIIWKTILVFKNCNFRSGKMYIYFPFGLLIVCACKDKIR